MAIVPPVGHVHKYMLMENFTIKSFALKQERLVVPGKDKAVDLRKGVP